MKLIKQKIILDTLILLTTIGNITANVTQLVAVALVLGWFVRPLLQAGVMIW
jgi:hypothetical protein